MIIPLEKGTGLATISQQTTATNFNALTRATQTTLEEHADAIIGTEETEMSRSGVNERPVPTASRKEARTGEQTVVEQPFAINSSDEVMECGNAGRVQLITSNSATVWGQKDDEATEDYIYPSVLQGRQHCAARLIFGNAWFVM